MNHIPELAARVEEDYKAEHADENKTAMDAAVQKALADERTRLEKIEAIAGQVSPELLADAKYKNPCTAEELAYKAMSENARKGQQITAVPAWKMFTQLPRRLTAARNRQKPRKRLRF